MSVPKGKEVGMSSGAGGSECSVRSAMKELLEGQRNLEELVEKAAALLGREYAEPPEEKETTTLPREGPSLRSKRCLPIAMSWVEARAGSPAFCM